jgi:hypothetical protein
MLSGEICELVLWREGDWSCALWRIGERYELRLHKNRELLLSAVLDTPGDARVRAEQWRGIVRKHFLR